jgi:hypothetical protein
MKKHQHARTSSNIAPTWTCMKTDKDIAMSVPWNNILIYLYLFRKQGKAQEPGVLLLRKAGQNAIVGRS